MDGHSHETCRYFATYSGIKLPIKLSQPLEGSAIINRNTYFRAFFDQDGRMTHFQKMVYGEIELQHRYQFHANGLLKQAEITDAEQEVTVLNFDESGTAI